MAPGGIPRRRLVVSRNRKFLEVHFFIVAILHYGAIRSVVQVKRKGRQWLRP